MTATLDSTTGVRAAGRPGHPRAHRIDDWRPDDPQFWYGGGDRVARRNLLFSVLSEHIGFLGPAYGFAPEDTFLLTTVPALVGSVLRLPYTFAVATFGGRN